MRRDEHEDDGHEFFNSSEMKAKAVALGMSMVASDHRPWKPTDARTGVRPDRGMAVYDGNDDSVETL